VVTVKIQANLGTGVEGGKQVARDLAQAIYKILPVGDVRGQVAKNELIRELFAKSSRMRRAGESLINGDVDMKPTLADHQEEAYLEDDVEDDECCQEVQGEPVPDEEEPVPIVHNINGVKVTIESK